MGFFSGMKSALGTPSSGGLLNFALGGTSGVDRSREAEQKRKLQGLLGAMPMGNDYAPPQYAAPNGEADPLAAVPQATRMQAWLRDYAAAGGNVPLTAMMPEAPKARAPQLVYGPKGGLGYWDGDNPNSVQEIRAPEAEVEKVPFGWEIDPATNMPRPRPGGPADPAYIRSLAEGRAASVAKYRAPPRGRAGGGGRSSGGGSFAPPGNPALDAIAAELKRRGKL